MKKLSISLVAALTLAALVTQPAQATLVMDLTGGGTPTACGTCGAVGETFGWSFTVLNAITIDGLGVWDAGSNGIGQATRAGVWTSVGMLLASAAVSNASTVVASASNQGSWLIETIAAITLLPGNYLLGAVFYTSESLAQRDSAFTNIADITVGGGVRNGAANTGFTAPLASFEKDIFGPTMRVADNLAPEPAGLALVGFGLFGLAAFRRRSV